jgi:hypothetical protein
MNRSREPNGPVRIAAAASASSVRASSGIGSPEYVRQENLRAIVSVMDGRGLMVVGLLQECVLPRSAWTV